MPKQNKSSSKDIFLAILLMVGMLSGFGLVYAVDLYQDTNGNSVELWTTDSNLNHPAYNVLHAPSGEWDVDYIQNSFNIWSTGVYSYQYNKTAVYLGNDTWTMTANGTAITSGSSLNYVAELPNIQSWLIKNITYKLRIDTPDNDIRIDTGVFFTEADIYDSNLAQAERYQRIYTDQTIAFQTLYPDHWYNFTVTPPLYETLNIHDLAQEKDEGALVIVIYDSNFDGFSVLTLTLEITIHGEQISEWSTLDSIKWSLGGATVLGFGFAILATDQFDIGGFIKDLPSRQKPRRRK